MVPLPQTKTNLKSLTFQQIPSLCIEERRGILQTPNVFDLCFQKFYEFARIIRIQNIIHVFKVGNNYSKRMDVPSTSRGIQRQCRASYCLKIDFKTVSGDRLWIPKSSNSTNQSFFLDFDISFEAHSRMAFDIHVMKIHE